MYLLDTTFCVELIDGNEVVTRKLESLGETLVATCVIVRGELMFMVYKSERRDENLVNVENFLRDLTVYPVGDEVADVYGQLKSDLIARFGPKEKAARKKIEIEELGVSENDLWIGSIALCNKLVVVSRDDDFDRIRQVSGLLVENWLSS